MGLSCLSGPKDFPSGQRGACGGEAVGLVSSPQSSGMLNAGRDLSATLKMTKEVRVGTGETPVATAAGEGGATITTAIFLNCGSIIRMFRGR